MGLINFPGERDRRTFRYRPIYYDEKEEELRQMFGHVDGRLEKESRDKDGNYVPGSYIRSSFRDSKYTRRKSASTAQRIIGMVGLVLFFIVLIFFVKFYSLL
ncbi:MAG: hypothetical protein GX125_10485 [Bacteroidales bacterium]|jgi:hypothetical protein|nr:hypothetical protein [Bacteroidota bacterium]NLO00669.1 hypothetical protein [Bacteroidales bacterium]